MEGEDLYEKVINFVQGRKVVMGAGVWDKNEERPTFNLGQNMGLLRNCVFGGCGNGRLRLREGGKIINGDDDDHHQRDISPFLLLYF